MLFDDFLMMSDNFGQIGTLSQGDVDGNGFIEFPDFLILANNFEASEVANVPETSSLPLLFLIVLGILGFCSRQR